MITLDTICNIWIIVCEIIGFLIFRAWDKIVAKYSDREIYKVITENHSGELHRWVYFKEGE